MLSLLANKQQPLHPSKPTNGFCIQIRLAILHTHPLPWSTAGKTFALSLNYDHGKGTEAGSASPPRSGKPDGPQLFPLEPRVQGRFACIVMAEGVIFFARARQAPDGCFRIAYMQSDVRKQP